jgi:hypothetical protein
LPVPHRMSADLDDLGAPLHTANPDPQRADSATRVPARAKEPLLRSHCVAGHGPGRLAGGSRSANQKLG